MIQSDKGMYIVCKECLHLWAIRSNKYLTENQLLKWVRDYMKEHNEVHK